LDSYLSKLASIVRIQPHFVIVPGCIIKLRITEYKSSLAIDPYSTSSLLQHSKFYQTLSGNQSTHFPYELGLFQQCITLSKMNFRMRTKRNNLPFPWLLTQRRNQQP